MGYARKRGFKPSYDKQQTAHYLSQHERWLKGRGLSPVRVEPISTISTSSKCTRTTTSEYFHHYLSTRPPLQWKVRVTEIESCYLPNCSENDPPPDSGGSSCYPGGVPQTGQPCSVRFSSWGEWLVFEGAELGEGFPGDLYGAGLLPEPTNSSVDAGYDYVGDWTYVYSYRRTDTFKTDEDGTYRRWFYVVEAYRDYSFEGSIPSPPPEWDSASGSWGLIYDSCGWSGNPSCSMDGSSDSGPPPPPSSSDWVCSKSYVVGECTCPDKTKTQAYNLFSPWTSEHVNRDWSASHAGARGKCKHQYGSHNFLGIPLPDPNDPKPKPGPRPSKRATPRWLKEQQEEERRWRRAQEIVPRLREQLPKILERRQKAMERRSGINSNAGVKAKGSFDVGGSSLFDGPKVKIKDRNGNKWIPPKLDV